MKTSIIIAIMVLLLFSLLYLIKVNRIDIKTSFTKEKGLALTAVGLIILVISFSIGYKLENYICYILMYLVLSLIIFKFSKYDLVSAPILFLAFYTFVIGLSPIVFLWYGVMLHFDYYMYILLPLAFYASSLILFTNVKEKKEEKEPKKIKKIGFDFIKRKTALRILLYISYAASVYFVIKNIDMYISA